MKRALCVALGSLACAPLATSGPGCVELGGAVELVRDLDETSGVAVGWRDPAVLWTHNDGDSDLYAMDRDGLVLAAVEIPARLRDWEDIEIAACASAGSCLYLADTGDNGERRSGGQIRIVRIAEPEVFRDAGAGPAGLHFDIFPIRLPDGPRDVEALFVLPGEEVHLVTKGTSHPVTVYRYPGPLRPDTVTLEAVQQLTGGPQQLLDRITGASASPDGSWVAIRSYQAVRFYRPQGDSLASVDRGVVNLRPLAEIQGEGIGIGSDGFVALTSEGGPLGGPPSLRLVRCRLG